MVNKVSDKIINLSIKILYSLAYRLIKSHFLYQTFS